MKWICLLTVLCLSATGQAQPVPGAFSLDSDRDILLSCDSTCFTLRASIPWIGTYANAYTVNKTARFNPPVSPAAAPVNGNRFYISDLYTQPVLLPFTFPFYGMFYDQVVLGANGTLSFDVTNQGGYAPWTITDNLPSDAYERALIMGVYQDIDMDQASSLHRQMKYEVIGTAPHRKFVYSIYKAPSFFCVDKINNSYQLTLYEGLGLVEVHVWEKEICTTWNGGKAIIGIQDYDRANGLMAPERTATSTAWGRDGMNEQWRFAPSVGPSLLKKVDLYTADGQFVMEGNATDDTHGNYSLSFYGLCPDSNFTQYIIQPVYRHFDYSMWPQGWPANNPDSLVYGRLAVNVIKPAVPHTAVFTAAEDSNWLNPANWHCGHVPEPGDAVIVTQGILLVETDITLASLNIRPGAQVEVTPGHHITILPH